MAATEVKKSEAKKASMLDDLGEGIPVRGLHFSGPVGPSGVTMPNGEAKKNMFAHDGKDGRPRVEIVYFPRARHHRVTVDRNGVVSVLMVHETWALWEPVEE